MVSSLLIVWAGTSSCGSENEETHVKDFTFYITETAFPVELNKAIEEVFKKLNQRTGLNRFRLTSDIKKANSKA